MDEEIAMVGKYHYYIMHCYISLNNLPAVLEISQTLDILNMHTYIHEVEIS